MEVFNPPLNFQNRMLQSDYIKIFEEVGFKYELTYKKSTHNIKIDKCFANYSKKDLEKLLIAILSYTNKYSL